MTAPSGPGIESDRRRLRYAEAKSDAWGLHSLVERGGEVAVRTDDPAVVLAALAAWDGWAGVVHLLPDDDRVVGSLPVVDDDGLDRLRASAPEGRAKVEDRETAAVPEIHTTWIVYTSGTTGAPKGIEHSLQSLGRTVSTGTTAAELTWGLLYDPNRMAGLQVLLQARATDSPLVAPSLHAPLRDRVGLMVERGVNALSATPTLWRQILQVPAAREWPLAQITLGGEIADQKVLSALSAAYPQARIFHVFASTETGAAFTVRDGLAGFPRRYLDTAPKGIRLDVRDGRLFIHAPGTGAAGDDGFVDTGDEVELTDDRVLFLGRSTGVVNVGGANVWPEQVETLLRSHPDVDEAVVVAKENPLAGHLLMATVTLDPTAEADGAGKRIRAWVREQAPATHVPARVKVVDRLDVSTTGKLSR